VKAALLAIVLLVTAGSAAATRLAPSPLTAEALLAADVQEKTVAAVAGGTWWAEPPAFDSIVYRADPQPQEAVSLTFEQLGGNATIVTTLYAFHSSHEAVLFLLFAELVGPAIDEKQPAIGDRHAFYNSTLADGRPLTRFFFIRGRAGVAISVNGQKWSTSKIAGIARPIDEGLQALKAGTLRPPVIPAADLGHLPISGAAPGPVLGTASIPHHAWATVDRDGTPQQVRDRLAKRGAKLLLRRYLRTDSITDVIETTLFTFPKASDAGAWFAPFGAGVRNGKGSIDPGETGPRSAYRHGRENYELRFATGRYVADVFCYAPFVQSPSTQCEDVVRTLAEHWYEQLSHTR
jgi:hypothetical protein